MFIHIDLEPPKRTTQSAQQILRCGRAGDGKLIVGKKRSDWLSTWLDALYVYLLPYRPSSPLLGPLSVHYELMYPYRKSEKKSYVKANKLIWKSTRPDCDNTVKAITDQLAKMEFFLDDAQIVDLRVQKMYGPKAYMEIEIEGLRETIEPF